jgi:probable rRNA maturation factor
MIEINNEQAMFEISDEIMQMIKETIMNALKMEHFIPTFEVNVIITDNENIKEINNTYRKINRETDVLSFPMLEYKNGFKKNIDDVDDTNPATGKIILGDIVISIEKASKQAEEYGHSINREIAFLTVHSILHLLGYDHEEEDDRTLMRTKEEQILEQMKLSR